MSMDVNVNGIRYHVEVAGNGYPLVLLHGFTGNAGTWRPLSKHWAPDSSLIMIDIIGHGLTDAPDQLEHYQMEAAVRDLSSVLEKMNIDKADFLGYSMGGRLALSFAATYPDKVRKLILESASPGLKTEHERIERQKSDRKLADLIQDQGIEAFVDYWENIPLFETQKNLPLTIRQEIRKQRSTNSVIGLVNSLYGMGTGAQISYWDQLEKLTFEVLLITGELDNKFCAIAKEMKEKLSHCQWTVVEECGHAIHVEQAEKFGTIVREFLKSIK